MTDETALNALREAALLSPENLPLRRHLAGLLLAAGRLAEAAGEYRAALALSPRDVDLTIGLAETYVRQGEYNLALRTLDPLVDMPDRPIRVDMLMVRAALPVNRPGAVYWYRHAIGRDPSQADPELAARLGLEDAPPSPPPPTTNAPVPVSPPPPAAAPDPAAGWHPSPPYGQSPPPRSPAPPAPTPPAPAPQVPAPQGPAPQVPAAGPPSLIPSSSAPAPGPAAYAPTTPALIPASPAPPYTPPQPAYGAPYGSAETEPTAEVERSRVTFADVAGMEGVKEALRMKLLLPAQQPELFAAYGKRAGGGVLLYGPPGAGKTHLARAAAGELGAAFVNVGLADILDMWTGSSERNLRATFEMARRNRPCVLFFDEVDALAARRSDMRQAHSRQIVNQFLAELDGVDEHANEGVLVLAATNAPWYIDVAFRRPGRFDQMVFVPPPDTVARAAMLSLMCRDKPLGKMDFDKVAKATEGFVGADLKGLVDRAVEAKLQESIRAGRPIPLSTPDLMAAARTMRPTAVREWLGTARNYVLHANESGVWDELLPWLRDLR
ncbi:AAA family ATPase [Streptosporangium sandarakinum]|uniref:AAA family ATPase n=1 Tax=Streptosporangium sandarakinum TaxID=1260955 RepID=UPI0033BAA2FF